VSVGFAAVRAPAPLETRRWWRRTPLRGGCRTVGDVHSLAAYVTRGLRAVLKPLVSVAAFRRSGPFPILPARTCLSLFRTSTLRVGGSGGWRPVAPATPSTPGGGVSPAAGAAFAACPPVGAARRPSPDRCLAPQALSTRRRPLRPRVALVVPRHCRTGRAASPCRCTGLCSSSSTLSGSWPTIESR